MITIGMMGLAAGLTNPPFNSLARPSSDCPEAEPDCDLSDWSIPKAFCENDCEAEAKYCWDVVAKWQVIRGHGKTQPLLLDR